MPTLPGKPRYAQQLTFAIPGQPRPKGRPRFSKAGHTYTPAVTRKYEQLVRVEGMKALTQWRSENQARHWNATGPFSLSAFLFMGDKRARDIDNCLKAITDGLNGLLYDDDKQLDEIYAFRDFDSREPRAVVTVARLRDPGI